MRRTLAIAAAGLILLSGSPAHASTKDRQVTATVETPALFDDEAGGDADADDPAIWVHPWDRSRSRVIGTAKNGGLRVYDLAGREVQAIPAGADGRFNNVDITNGNLVVVTDRGRDQLRFYRIDPVTALLTDVTVDSPPLLFSADQDEVALQATGYGLAAYGNLLVVSRRHTTRLGLFEVVTRGGKVSYRKRETLDLPSVFTLRDGTSWTPCEDPGEAPQVEGMVIDPRTNSLYASQEDVALWRIDLRTKRRTAVEYVTEFGAPYDTDCTPTGPGEGGRIHADVEGATIYGDYLLASSQGDSRFFVYDRHTNKPLTSFTVTDTPAKGCAQFNCAQSIDGVQHSDGAAATSTPLPGYPHGLLVLHDGENTPADGRTSTNFKFVDWRRLGLA